MKLTLTKQITLYSATVYMKITKDVLRKDIKEYLNGKRFDNNLLNNRINNYLKEIHIYDDNSYLTKLGKTVKETSYLPTPEEGKYKIWYSQNDEHFGNTIMYFRREAPNDKSQVEELNVYFEKNGHFLMPARERDEVINYTQFSLLETKLNGKIFSNSETITVTLIMEDGKETYCTFSGKIGKDGATELNHKQHIPFDIKLEDSITEILPNYNSMYKRLMVKFNDKNKNFVLSNYKCTWIGFSGTIDSINLMPFDLENAKRWRDSLVRDIVAQQYLSPQDFQSKVIETNDNPAFEKYRNYLDVPESKNFKTETGSEEYWHLNAPIDLNTNEI